MEVQQQARSRKRVKSVKRRAYRINTMAESLDVSPSFVRLEIARGHLKAFHLGTAVFVSAEEFERYLAERAK
jgi:excisionase family DNA binding protein